MDQKLGIASRSYYYEVKRKESGTTLGKASIESFTSSRNV